ncbi:ABC transporter permease [Pyrinomonas methylaliphatogenes]|jgi:putative ABC transport system permease protein|uniref:ABC-type transport system, involved in lipoprotein release, permease component n=1 Tax=Pyrinomonas methylaliphatogenes TaxID=454194 RepID=A0A0B6WXQ9_9BACT|nr:ABC transporter permease [Pyrinomonas methylaliphatogenes]CDM64960.1 ABC-type transport system, involved in lipoprotein release, permease component [Pyrinomonas methylaliphatogenes]
MSDKSLVIANIRQRPVRTLISIVGVALGVSLILLFTGLSRGMSNDLQRRSLNIRAELIFTRPGSLQLTSSTANLSTRYVQLLEAIPGVERALPVIRYIYQDGRGFGFEQIEGVDWASYAMMNGINLIEGRAPAANDEVVIDAVKARERNLRAGGTIQLFGNRPYRVVGIYSPESGARVKMSLAAMQEVLEAPGKCTYILVKCREGEDVLQVARRIDQTLPGNKIQLTRDVVMNVERSIPLLPVFLRVLVGLGAVISALVVMLAMYTTITERTYEIGILKSLGASHAFIISEIEKEALLISAIGSALGFAVALIAGRLIHDLYGLIFEFSWGWTITAIMIGVLGGALGALYPAVRAARLDPIEALAYE